MARHAEKKKLARWQVTLLVLLAILFLLASVVSGVLTHYLNKINRPDPNQTFITEEEFVSMVMEEEEPAEDLDVVLPEDVVLNTEGTIQLEGDITNILLIGQDRRPGEGRARSDSIILCSINKTTNTITLVSFLRDMYVQIPGFQDNRINAAYAFGGAELLNKTLKVNFGIDIDANVEVDFAAFEAVIDALGGVDITLTDAEYQYFIDCNHRNTVRGTNHFDGKEALFYSRIRDIDSDFGRTNRQRNVLTAVFNQVRNAEPGELLQLADTILPMLTVDLSNAEIIGYIMEFAPMLAGCNFVTSSVPAADAYYNANIREMAVLVPNLPACRAFLQELLSAN